MHGQRWAMHSDIHMYKQRLLNKYDICKKWCYEISVAYKKVRYAYQEWPHPTDTASPHSQKVERRQHGYNQFQNRRHKQLRERDKNMHKQ
jgi:hypothetical protein